jgi:hypothetical protein
VNTHEPDIHLETLLVATSEFAANAIVIVLNDAGIEARAFGTIQGGLGLALGADPSHWGTPVQVRSCDLERARQTLDQARQDSIDIDWDAVDLGTFTETTATPSSGMPLAAKIAFAATLLAILLMLLSGILMTLPF